MWNSLSKQCEKEKNVMLWCDKKIDETIELSELFDVDWHSFIVQKPNSHNKVLCIW